MQHKPRYKLMRRILFPYSGEEPLSLKQGLRVMLAWILFFPLCISLLTLVFVVIGSYPLQRMVEFLVFAFISSAFIFGILGLLIVIMNNRSARFRQTWKTQRGRQ